MPSLPSFAYSVGLLLLGVVIAGCGQAKMPTISMPQTTATTPTPSPSQPTPAAAVSNAVQGKIEDQQGDRASIAIGIGAPQPLSQLSDPVATACNQTISGYGQSVSSAVAVPLQVTAEVTSSRKTPLAVNLNETGAEVELLEAKRQEIEPLTNQTNLAEFWAASNNQIGPQCLNRSQGAEVTWTAETASPHTSVTWNAWLIVLGAITPNDPSGKAITDNLLITPRATVAEGAPMNLTPHGSGWTRCAKDEYGWLAVDPHIDVSRANVCSSVLP
ncbi:MAG: hypothetical protein ACRDK4_04060 [Solirubrobacteraceae bacterium]